MASPRQFSCVVLSRIFLPKRAPHTITSSLLAQNYICRLSCIRQEHLAPVKKANLRPRKEMFAKPFCTDRTSAENQSGTITPAAGQPNKSAGRTVKHVQDPSSATDKDGNQTEIQYSNGIEAEIEKVVKRHDHVGSETNVGREGNIKIGAESLYDLSSDLNWTTSRQQKQEENTDFYRRRVESEWSTGKTFIGYQDSDQSRRAGPGQFMDAPPIIAKNRNPNHNLNYYCGFAGVLCCSIVFALAFFKKERKDTVELFIAKSWVADREGNVAEAEELLHKALNMAQDNKNIEGVTYIYDQLANLAMRHGNLTKAESLFKETLKRLISSGMAQDDSAVIEISLKLARMYDRMRRYDDAEQGFQWCITTTEKKLAQPSDKETTQNLQSLLGMCLDCYARYLAAHSRLQEAKEMYKRALVICENELKIDGIPHPQTATLLNDLGTVHDLGSSYDEAVQLIERAADLAEQRSPHDLPTVLCNLASVKMHAEKFEEARVHYKRALSLAERQGDAVAISEIKNSLAQLETNEFLKDQKGRQGSRKREGQKS